MTRLEVLRIALEAGIAAQLGLIILFLLTNSARRHATALYLVLLCAGLTIEILLNALASTALLSNLRLFNFFFDLMIGPLVLGFVARTGREGPFFRVWDVAHLFWPIAGLAALVSNVNRAPDLLVCCSQFLYLFVAAWLFWQRAEVLRSARLLGFAGALVGAFGGALGLRIWVVLDTNALASYRESMAYIGILMLFLVMSSLLMWTALRDPQRLSWRPLTDSLSPDRVDEIEAETKHLIEGERLYLQPELSLADVAKRLDVPPRHVSKVISSRMGENFSSYLNRKRAEAAARTLRNSMDIPVTTILYDSGFGSKSAFQREFRRRFGTTPSEYRNRYRN